MPALDNLVHETSTSTGTGNLTVAGVGGKQRGSDAFGTGDNGADNPVMFISNRDADPGDEWEVVQCYFDDANTLVRSATPIASSNSGDPVDFSAGTKDITNDVDAAEQSSAESWGNWTGAVGETDSWGNWT